MGAQGLLLTGLLLSGCAKKSTPAEQNAGADSEETCENGRACGDETTKAQPPEQTLTKAPEKFAVTLETTKGDVVIDLERSLAPHGVDHFYKLVKEGYYTDIAIFRVVPGFVIQFGMHGDPEVNAVKSKETIPDDPIKGTNARGTVTFAKTNAPNSRNTQIFINLADNARLDGMGFATLGKVRDMQAVDAINGEYRESPNQGMIASRGNAYLRENFPNLDYVKRAKLTE